MAASRTTTRTTLFLSRNARCDPFPLCAHPSGYFIEYPAAEFRKVRKTWLSGMSPVAAAFASACSAPADAVLPAAVVATGVVVVTDVVGVAVFVAPQPATTRAASSDTALRRIPDMLGAAA